MEESKEEKLSRIVSRERALMTRQEQLKKEKAAVQREEEYLSIHKGKVISLIRELAYKYPSTRSHFERQDSEFYREIQRLYASLDEESHALVKENSAIETELTDLFIERRRVDYEEDNRYGNKNGIR